jgi:hypothetical protein
MSGRDCIYKEYQRPANSTVRIAALREKRGDVDAVDRTGLVNTHSARERLMSATERCVLFRENFLFSILAFDHNGALVKTLC